MKSKLKQNIIKYCKVNLTVANVNVTILILKITNSTKYFFHMKKIKTKIYSTFKYIQHLKCLQKSSTKNKQNKKAFGRKPTACFGIEIQTLTI